MIVEEIDADTVAEVCFVPVIEYYRVTRFQNPFGNAAISKYYSRIPAFLIWKMTGDWNDSGLELFLTTEKAES